VLLYTIEKGATNDSFVQKSLHFEGRVDVSQRSSLHSVLFDTLLSCDHLVVNFDKVSEFDASLILLLCSAHQTTKLLNKQLTIQGKGSMSFMSVHEKGICPKGRGCFLESCYLRERAWLIGINTLERGV
jgi:ABC-type transporter Mla MlaB component